MRCWDILRFLAFAAKPVGVARLGGVDLGISRQEIRIMDYLRGLVF